MTTLTLRKPETATLNASCPDDDDFSGLDDLLSDDDGDDGDDDTDPEYCTRISADQLTVGDLIRHLGNLLKIVTEPQYTTRGIEFDALPLEVTDKETQGMCFDPRWQFDLLGHQPVFA